MPSSTLLSSLYDFLSYRRGVVYAATLVIIGLCVLISRDVNVQEDIRSMLPDSPSELRVDFELMQQAPFARKVIVNLKRRSDADPMALTDAVESLRKEMSPPHFTHVVSSPSGLAERPFFALLFESLPNLSTEQDVANIAAGVTPQEIEDRMKQAYMRILSPEGWGLKGLAEIDPLGLRQMVLGKLGFLRLIPRMRLGQKIFLSEDGMNALLIADTNTAITDSRGAQEMLDHVQALVDKVIPPEIEVTLISGHRYAAANAEIIKRDVFVVLSFSTIAILAIFVFFLRNWRAVFVFLVPVAALCVAVAGISVIYDKISAITIGFGSVLLGISVDFALHIYFALRTGTRRSAAVITEVSRPILFGGMTTLATFGALLFSDLPGQRQIATFSVIGVGVSLIFSLVVLPQMLAAMPKSVHQANVRAAKESKGTRRWVIGMWSIMLVLCAWQGTKLHFDGDLRSISAVTTDIVSAEQRLAETWGDVRGTAMIFSEGRDLQSALEVNERLFNYLRNTPAADQIISLAPILPSMRTQLRNQARWVDFWSNGKGKEARKLMEQKGEPFGFSQRAFEAYFETLLAKPSPITPAALRRVGLGQLLDTFIVQAGGKVHVLTFVPDTPEIGALMGEGMGRPQDSRWVSQLRFGEMVSGTIGHDFVRYVIGAFLIVLFLLIVLFRNPGKVLYAMIPVITGLAFMCGMMGWLGIGFNLFNIIATILIIGLGVDYGIFMVCRISEGHSHRSERAVLVSGLTTLAGLGGLVLAKHPALHSIGLTVFLGIGAAIPGALLVIPALYRKKFGVETSVWKDLG
jgi:predicted exporter